MSDTIAPAVAHNPDRAAIDGFLTRYRGGTRKLYELDLRIYTDWCTASGVPLLGARRSDIERFREHLERDRGNAARSVRRRLQTIRSFYRLATADELIDRDPTVMLAIPRHTPDPDRILWLDRYQVGAALHVAAAESPAHHALIAVMAMLGLRVSEACSIDVASLRQDAVGQWELSFTGKGGKAAVMTVPLPLLRILQTAIGDRTDGPIILTRAGRRQTRGGAYAWVKIIARKAALPQETHPHSFRHAAVSVAIDGGASPVEAQAFARHASFDTTLGYYRRTRRVDEHPAYLAARAFSTAA